MKAYYLRFPIEGINSNSRWESPVIDLYNNDSYSNFSITRSSLGLDLLGNTWTGTQTYELTGIDHVYLSGVSGNDLTSSGVPDHINLPGTSGNYVAAGLGQVDEVSGNIEIVVRAALNNYSTGVDQVLLGKSKANRQDYVFAINNECLKLTYVINVSTPVSITATSSNLPISDNQTYWFKVTRTASNGQVRFYWAPDADSEPSAWTSGGVVTETSGNLYSSNAPVEIGSLNGGISSRSNGRFFRAIIRNNIDGTIIADFDPSLITSTTQQTLAASTGETYQIYQSTTGKKSFVGVTNGLTGDIEIVARLALSNYSGNGQKEAQDLVSKWTSSDKSFTLRVDTNRKLSFLVSTDGEEFLSASSSIGVPFANGQAGWVKSVFDASSGEVSFYAAVDQMDEPYSWSALGIGTLINDTATPVTNISLFDTPAPLSIGSLYGSSEGRAVGDLYRVLVRAGQDGAEVSNFDASAFDSLAASEVDGVSGETWLVTRAGSPSSYIGTGGEGLGQITDSGVVQNGRFIDTSGRIDIAQYFLEIDSQVYDTTADRYLSLPGTSYNFAWTPHRTAFDSSFTNNDVDLQVKVTLDDWQSIGSKLDEWFCGMWDDIDGQVFRFGLYSNGTLRFSIRDTLSNTTKEYYSDATGFANNTTHWVRVTLDADNGSNQHVVKFWVSEDGISWTLNKTLTNSGSVQLPIVTETYFTIGDLQNNGSQAYNGISEALSGKIYQVKGYFGESSDLVVNADFTDSNLLEQTEIVDQLGNTWTIEQSSTSKAEIVSTSSLVGNSTNDASTEEVSARLFLYTSDLTDAIFPDEWVETENIEPVEEINLIDSDRYIKLVLFFDGDLQVRTDAVLYVRVLIDVPIMAPTYRRTPAVLERFASWMAIRELQYEEATPEYATPQSLGGKIINLVSGEWLDDLTHKAAYLEFQRHIDTVDLTQPAWIYRVANVPFKLIYSIQTSDNIDFALAASLREFYDAVHAQYIPDDLHSVDPIAWVDELSNTIYFASDYGVVYVNNEALTLQAHHVWNYVDELGLLVDLTRHHLEDNETFRLRIKDVYANKPGVGVENFKKALRRELNLWRAESATPSSDYAGATPTLLEMSEIERDDEYFTADGLPTDKFVDLVDRLSLRYPMTWGRFQWGRARWDLAGPRYEGFHTIPYRLDATPLPNDVTQSGIGDGMDLYVHRPDAITGPYEFTGRFRAKGKIKSELGYNWPEINSRLRISGLAHRKTFTNPETKVWLTVELYPKGTAATPSEVYYHSFELSTTADIDSSTVEPSVISYSTYSVFDSFDANDDYTRVGLSWIDASGNTSDRRFARADVDALILKPGKRVGTSYTSLPGSDNFRAWFYHDANTYLEYSMGATPVYPSIQNIVGDNDSFNRSNTTSGLGSFSRTASDDTYWLSGDNYSWTNHSGSWQVISNQASPSYMATPTPHLSTVSLNASTYKVSAKLNVSSPTESGLLARFKDANNYWRFYYQNGTGFKVDKVSAGSATAMFTSSGYAMASGKKIQILNTRDRIYFMIEDTIVYSSTDTTHAKETKVGIYAPAANTTNDRIEDFTITEGRYFLDTVVLKSKQSPTSSIGLWESEAGRNYPVTINDNGILDTSVSATPVGDETTDNYVKPTVSWPLDIVVDKFSRTSTTTLGTNHAGDAWTALNGTWGIDANGPYVVSPVAGTRYFAVMDGQSDGFVEAKVSVMQTGGNGYGLAFRMKDANNGYFLQSVMFAGVYYVRLNLYLNGVSTYGTYEYNNSVYPEKKFLAGDTIRVTFQGSKINCYIIRDNRSIFLFSRTDEYHTQNTKHGLYFNTLLSGSTSLMTGRFTNFRMGGAPVYNRTYKVQLSEINRSGQRGVRTHDEVGENLFLPQEYVNIRNQKYLYTSGSATQYAESASSLLTTDGSDDLDVIACINPEYWTSNNPQHIISKWTTGSTKSFYFKLHQASSGKLSFGWSSTGSNEIVATSDTAVPYIVGMPAWVRAYLDVNNGSSNHEVKFYYSYDDVNTSPASVQWKQLGSTIQVAGTTTTSVYSGSQKIWIGKRNDGVASDRFSGKIYKVYVQVGTSATELTNIDFNTWTAGATTGKDAQNNTYDLSSGAAIQSDGWSNGDYLNVPQSTTSSYLTSSASVANYTGDLDIRVRVLTSTWLKTTGQRDLVGRWVGAASSSNSYYFTIISNGKLRLGWRGASAEYYADSSVTLDGTVPTDEVVWLRAVLDVDNGSSNHAVKFYYSTDDVGDSAYVNWTALGTDQTADGLSATTSVNSSSSNLTIGRRIYGGGMFNGRIYRAEFWTGIGKDYVVQITRPSVKGSDNTAFSLVGSATLATDSNENGTAYVPVSLGDVQLTAPGFVNTTNPYTGTASLYPIPIQTWLPVEYVSPTIFTGKVDENGPWRNGVPSRPGNTNWGFQNFTVTRTDLGVPNSDDVVINWISVENTEENGATPNFYRVMLWLDNNIVDPVYDDGLTYPGNAITEYKSDDATPVYSYEPLTVRARLRPEVAPEWYPHINSGWFYDRQQEYYLYADPKEASTTTDELILDEVVGLGAPVIAYTDEAEPQLMRQVAFFNSEIDPAYDSSIGDISSVWLPGTSNNYIAASSRSTASLTNDMDIRVKVALDSWLGTDQTLVGKWVTGDGNYRSYNFSLKATGYLSYSWSVDGSADSSKCFELESSVAITERVDDGETIWVRVRFDRANDAATPLSQVDFYTSLDGVEWEQLGVSRTSSSTETIYDSSASAAVGIGAVNWGDTNLATGKFYEVQIYSDLIETLSAHFKADQIVAPDRKAISSSTGETWEVIGAEAVSYGVDEKRFGFLGTRLSLWNVEKVYGSGTDVLYLSYPDIYSIRVRDLTSGVVVPIAAASSASNEVVTIEPTEKHHLYEVKYRLSRSFYADNEFEHVDGTQRTKLVFDAMPVRYGASSFNVSYEGSIDRPTMQSEIPLSPLYSNMEEGFIFISHNEYTLEKVLTQLSPTTLINDVDDYAALSISSVDRYGNPKPNQVFQVLSNWGTVENNSYPAATLSLPGTGSNSVQTTTKLPNYVKFSGSSGSYGWAPSSTGNSLDDLDLRVLVAPDSWAGSTNAKTLVAKWDSGGEKSFAFRIKSLGDYLQLVWSDGQTEHTVDSTAATTSFAAASLRWVRVTLDFNNGSNQHVVKFYTSVDGETWTQFGSTVTNSGITSIVNSMARLTVGAENNDGSAALLAGRVYRADVRDGLDGDIVGSFDPQALLSTSASSFVSSSGEQWTIANANVGAHLELLNELDVRVLCAPDAWTSSQTLRCLASQYEGDTGSRRSWAFSLYNTGALDFRWSDDGSSGASHFTSLRSSTNLSALAAGAMKWLRVTASLVPSSGYEIKFYTSDDGVDWTQLGSTRTGTGPTSFYVSDVPVQIGASFAANLATTSQFPGRIYKAEICDGVNGQIVASPDFRSCSPGSTTTFTDAQGNYWTFNKSATNTLEVIEDSRFVKTNTEGYASVTLMGSNTLPTESPQIHVTGGVDVTLGFKVAPKRVTSRRIIAAPADEMIPADGVSTNVVYGKVESSSFVGVPYAQVDWKKGRSLHDLFHATPNVDPVNRRVIADANGLFEIAGITSSATPDPGYWFMALESSGAGQNQATPSTTYNTVGDVVFWYEYPSRNFGVEGVSRPPRTPYQLRTSLRQATPYASGVMFPSSYDEDYEYTGATPVDTHWLPPKWFAIKMYEQYQLGLLGSTPGTIDITDWSNINPPIRDV